MNFFLIYHLNAESCSRIKCAKDKNSGKNFRRKIMKTMVISGSVRLPENKHWSHGVLKLKTLEFILIIRTPSVPELGLTKIQKSNMHQMCKRKTPDHSCWSLNILPKPHGTEAPPLIVESQSFLVRCGLHWCAFREKGGSVFLWGPYFDSIDLQIPTDPPAGCWSLYAWFLSWLHNALDAKFNLSEIFCNLNPANHLPFWLSVCWFGYFAFVAIV